MSVAVVITHHWTCVSVDSVAESVDSGRHHSDEKKKYLELDDDERRHFVMQLSDVFWQLHASRPVNILTAPAGMPGTILTQSRSYTGCAKKSNPLGKIPCLWKYSE